MKRTTALARNTWPVLILIFGASAASAQESGQGTRDFAVSGGEVLLAPYVWKCSGTGAAARAEAAMPGAYLKARVRGTGEIDLLVDGTGNSGNSADAMPIIDCSVDGGAFKSTQLSARSEVYALPIAAGLEAGAPHEIDVVFRSAKLGERWETAKPHLRIAGLRMAAEATLLPCPRLPHNAIAFGDSITEGVLVEGPGPFYANLFLNNARATWAPIVCGALQAEYGQLGTGGQGMVKPIQIPPLPQTWDRYDAASSRLTRGRLVPEPDYVLCCMGTNDSKALKADPLAPQAWRTIDITAAYTQWLVSVRAACPRAAIFCITPPTGLHAREIASAVAARRRAGDSGVNLIDTTSLQDRFMPIRFVPGTTTYSLTAGATQLAIDGVHPSVYGNAFFGALIAAEISRRLSPSAPRAHAAARP